jgi:NhaP-type Na+/H+ or K+/H+ antiporter
MPHSPLADPALSVALALAVGMLAQSLALHLRVPGIVLLLAAGVLLGPDVLGVIRPGTLGPALQTLVGFAVAVVLFEGGMNLNLAQLRREARSIRQLVTVGAAVTALGGAVAARLLLGWSWTLSLLFGTLVMVTGPTVITPLLRRIKVQRKVATVLEAEGVFGDAIGALVAVVALELVVRPGGGLAAAFHPSPGGLAAAFHLSPGGLPAWLHLGPGGLAALAFAVRLGFGLAAGLAGGALIAALLRSGIVPEGLQNVFTLAFVLAFYQSANSLVPESGIVAVILAGLSVGNRRARVVAELKDFKEQLTVMFIGMLFVLLAADVRLAQVRALGWRGLATVLALMFVVRPLNVLAGTFATSLTLRERAFIAWLAPRGIVAAAVSSLFAQTLAGAGIAGGPELRALVFLVIAVTVVVQGLTGGLVAGFLGLRRVPKGWVVVGANGLGRTLGDLFGAAGHEVVLLDSNPQASRAAEEAGFRVLYGNALAEPTLRRAELDARLGAMAATSNEEVNYLFARRARLEHKLGSVWAAVRRDHRSVEGSMLTEIGAHLLFGEPRAIALWAQRLERGAAPVERFLWTGAAASAGSPAGAGAAGTGADGESPALPLALFRGGEILPVDETTAPRDGDVLAAALAAEAREAGLAHLRARGWEPIEESAELQEPAAALLPRGAAV